jgi:hypothetical protein
MDLHRELNALQTALAQETLDGAAVYGLADEDRPRVLAFMAGLSRTEGETISLNGYTGAIYPGTPPIVTRRPDRELATIATWREAKAPDASPHPS